MKKYKKVDNKYFVTEEVDTEVDKDVLNSRVDTLNLAIKETEDKIARLTEILAGYQTDKDGIKKEIKEIEKL